MFYWQKAEISAVYTLQERATIRLASRFATTNAKNIFFFSFSLKQIGQPQIWFLFPPFLFFETRIARAPRPVINHGVAIFFSAVDYDTSIAI